MKARTTARSYMQARRKLASPAEVAEYLGRSVGTLANWRCAGTGPAYIKSAGATSAKGEVLYRWDDVENWLDSRTIRPVKVG